MLSFVLHDSLRTTITKGSQKVKGFLAYLEIDAVSTATDKAINTKNLD
jgi:hypothetical protein